VKFVATKKGMTTNFCSPLSFAAVLGSGIRDPGWVKIRIRDQHPGYATLHLCCQRCWIKLSAIAALQHWHQFTLETELGRLVRAAKVDTMSSILKLKEKTS
jgi:hypothetical protein